MIDAQTASLDDFTLRQRINDLENELARREDELARRDYDLDICHEVIATLRKEIRDRAQAQHMPASPWAGPGDEQT